MYNSIQDSVGDSLAQERMAAGFDYLWWEEFRDSGRGLDRTFTPAVFGKGAVLNNLENLVQLKFFSLPPIVLIFGLAYVLLHTFFAGGILNTYNQSRPAFHARQFFHGAGSLFGRFLGITLISWVFFIIFVGFFKLQLDSMLLRIDRQAGTEIIPFYWSLFFNFLILFLLLFLQMVFDYARIIAVVKPKKSVLQAAAAGFRFVLTHPGSTFGLYYLLFLSGVGMTLIYMGLSSLISQAAFIGILLAFILQQAFIFLTIWMRCWLYSSQLELFRFL